MRAAQCWHWRFWTTTSGIQKDAERQESIFLGKPGVGITVLFVFVCALQNLLSPCPVTETTCTLLKCTHEEFLTIYDDDMRPINIIDISDDVLAKVVHPSRERLCAAMQPYRLDDLWFIMLKHAPHTLGEPCVVVAIHTAYEKKEDAAIDLANAWVDQLFLPSQTVPQYFSLLPLIPGF